MSDRLTELLLVLAAAVLGWLPGALRNWRKEYTEEVTRRNALATEILARGRLEARVDELEKDLHGVASMARTRIGALEKKGAALEVRVTGQLPRASGEGAAVS